LRKIYSNRELYENASKLSEGQNINIFENQNIPISNCYVVFENKGSVVDTSIISPSNSQVSDDFLENITPVESCSISDLSALSPQRSSINKFLANWAVEFNISHNAVNGLLKGLKNNQYSINSLKNLPSDSRTLLKIPSNISKEIRTVEPGMYFGLANGILKHVSPNINKIQVVIGIGGLGYVYIYIYLSDFVKETKDLILHGISINNNRISVSNRVFCYDVPAKSFILKFKGHSGFSS